MRSLRSIARKSRVVAPPDASVVDVAAALDRAGSDAALVVDSDAAVLGILTHKDISRAIARSASLHTTPARDLMTPDPASCRPDEDPQTAFNLMLSGRFRHILVLDPTPTPPQIDGIVDVLALYSDLVPVFAPHSPRSHHTTSRSTWAFWASTSGGSRHHPTTAAARPRRAVADVVEAEFPHTTEAASVREGAQIMAATRTAAVLVLSDDGALRGILSAAAVVASACVAAQDPDATRVTAVMTPNPDVVGVATCVDEALRRMHNRACRHLPVVADDGLTAVGMVDIMRLMKVALHDAERSYSQNMASVAAGRAAGNGPGAGGGAAPARASFWNLLTSAIGLSGEDEEQAPSPRASPARADRPRASEPATPNRPAPGRGHRRRTSMVRRSSFTNLVNMDAEETTEVVFKLKDLNDDVRRIPMTFQSHDFNESFDQFLSRIRAGFGVSSKQTIKVKYIDDEGDEVVITNDTDLAECITVVSEMKSKTVQLRVSVVPDPDRSPAPSLSPLTMSATTSVAEHESARVSHPAADSVPDPATEVSEDPVDVALERGRESIASNDFDRAVGHFDAALALDPGCSGAYLGRGAAHLLKADFVEAEQDYRKAVELLLEDSSVGSGKETRLETCWVGLAEALVETKRYEEALEALASLKHASDRRQAVDTFVLDALDAEMSCAKVAFDAGEYSDAIPLLTRAIRLDESLVSRQWAGSSYKRRASIAYEQRGQCYFEMGDHALALEDFQTSVKLDARLEAMAGEARALSKLECGPQAFEAYRRAILGSGSNGALRQRLLREAEVVKIRYGLGNEDSSRGVEEPDQKTEEIKRLGSMLKNMQLPGKK